MSVSSTTSSASTALQPPVYKPEEYSVAGVVLKFFEEKAKDISKVFSYTTFWLGQAIPNLPAEARSFSATMGDFKNFISATEVPKKIMEARDAVNRFWTDLTTSGGPWSKVAEAGREVFKKATSLTNSVVDSVDFSSRFLPIDQNVMSWLKGLNFAATLGGAGNGAIEQIQNFCKTTDADAQKRTLYMINLARDVSYVAVGVIGVASFVTGAAIVPWMIVAALTSGLGFTIGGYFYEKLYDPEGKGKNLNPEIVLQNNAARRRFEAGIV